jgi:hypothetical protein
LIISTPIPHSHSSLPFYSFLTTIPAIPQFHIPPHFSLSFQTFLNSTSPIPHFHFTHPPLDYTHSSLPIHLLLFQTLIISTSPIPHCHSTHFFIPLRTFFTLIPPIPHFHSLFYSTQSFLSLSFHIFVTSIHSFNPPSPFFHFHSTHSSLPFILLFHPVLFFHSTRFSILCISHILTSIPTPSFLLFYPFLYFIPLFFTSFRPSYSVRPSLPFNQSYSLHSSLTFYRYLT